jgi:hypothetical protein
MDGGDNNDSYSSVNLPFPFPDAIQEFSVQANGLSPRYGVHSGGTVNIVTKSGTNRYHGNLFEFLRTFDQPRFWVGSGPAKTFILQPAREAKKFYSAIAGFTLVALAMNLLH